MKLQLDGEYRVSTDRYNWTLERLVEVKETKDGNKTGKVRKEWQLKGHFGGLQALLRGMASQGIKDVGSLKECRQIEARLHEMIDALPEKLKKAAKEAQEARPPVVECRKCKAKEAGYE